jgi:glycosyltransferase involved in cell wall biosynthesis
LNTNLTNPISSANKAKILLIGPCYPYRGGIALTMSYIYKALTDSELFDLRFVNYSTLYPEILFPGTTQYDDSDEHFIKVPSVRILSSINPISWWKTAKYIEQEQPDLVAIDWWQPFFGPAIFAVTFLLSSTYKNKLLLITENVISHEARFIDRFLTKMGLRYASTFLAFSKKVVSDLANFAAKQPVYRSELPVYDWFVEAEPEAVERERRKLGFTKEHRILLFFGYVRKYKGLDILIEAFHLLAKQHDDMRLLVCGEFYDNPKEYSDIIDKHQLNDKIIVVNQYIPNEEVTKYFELSNLVVQPYRSATQSGILNLAYGCTKPVLVTDVGGLQEFVNHGETGIIVPVATPEAVAEGVNKFFELSQTVDFKHFIKQKVANNAFGQIAQTFKEITEKANVV